MLFFSVISSLFLTFSFCSCPLIPLSFPLVPPVPHSPILHLFPSPPSSWPSRPDNDLSVVEVVGYPQAALGENKRGIKFGPVFYPEAVEFLSSMDQWNIALRGWTGCFVCRSVSFYQCVSVFRHCHRLCSVANDVEMNRGPDGWLLFYSVRLSMARTSVQLSGVTNSFNKCTFTYECTSVNCGQWVKSTVTYFLALGISQSEQWIQKTWTHSQWRT